jgi:hypothetical protein
MSCGKLADGQPCTMANECAHNFCQQGVCCATACAGTCASCALAGTLGTCASVPSGSDPLGQCADQGMATCGTDGSCNGSGACRKYAAGTVCVPATCTGSTQTPNATCNASNACVTPANVSCVPYACGTNGACRPTCSTATDCSGAPYVCIGSTCTANTMLTVKLKNPDTTANPQWLTMALQITNNGTTAIPLSDLTVRYYYTYDITAPATAVVTQAGMCNYAQTPPGNCGNVVWSGPSGTPPVGPWVAVSPAKTNADYYYQAGFGAAAGNLNQNATAEFQVQFHKNDWTNYTQANDYSYNGSMTSFATTTKVTVYRVGALVYGTEPP